MTKSISIGFILLLACSPALAFNKPADGIVLTEKIAGEVGLTVTKKTFFGQTHFTLKTSAELKEKLHQITVTMYSDSEWISTIDSGRPDLKNVYKYRYNQDVIKKINVFIIYRTGEKYQITYDATT